MPIFRPQTKHHGRSGFTLIEVLMALVVLAIVSAVLARVLQGNLRAKKLQRDQVNALHERAESFTLQVSGELDDPLVTIERIDDETE